MHFSGRFWVHQGQFPPESSSVELLFVYLGINTQHINVTNADKSSAQEFEALALVPHRGISAGWDVC